MNKRKILALIFVTVIINYLDRTNISVASVAFSKELGFDKIQMGYIFSAFGFAYSLSQIPGGLLADRFSTRIFYPLLLILWSIFTLLQGFINSLSAFIWSRRIIGVFEAPSYPINNKIVTAWFPKEERAGAIAVYTSGQFVGLAFLSPILTIVQSYIGWRGLLISSGVLGIIWAIIWFVFYKEPTEKQAVSVEKSSTFELKFLAKAFTSRKLWGIYISQFCLGSITIFFLTWFPTYLVEFKHMDFIKSGYLGSIPFLGAFVGVLLSGFVSDKLIKIGKSVEFSRKTPVIIGMLISSVVVLANYTDSPFWIILFLTVAFFGNGLASINWVFISLLAPEKHLGMVGGVFNFIGGLSAAVIPIAIGYLAKDGNFENALILMASIAGLGVCSYLFLVGKIETVNFD